MKLKNDFIFGKFDIAEDVVRKVENGYYREKYGLETHNKSDYAYFRNDKGYSDAHAQIRVYLIRRILKVVASQNLIRERM